MKEIIFNFKFIGTKDTLGQFTKLKSEITSLNVQLKELKALGNKGAFEKLNKELTVLKTKLSAVRNEIKATSREFSKASFNSQSLINATQRLIKARLELTKLAKESVKSAAITKKQKYFDNLNAEIRATEANLNRLNSQINNSNSGGAGGGGGSRGGGGGSRGGRGPTGGGIGGFLNQRSSFISRQGASGALRDIIQFSTSSVLAAGSVTTAVIIAGVEIVKLNAKISGLQASVRKTTNLSIEGIEELTDRLKQLDTPTGLDELLKISQEAGRFGVQGTKQVGDFTEALNTLSITLGDEFTGGVEQITTVLAQLSNNMYGVTNDGTIMADRFNKIGNALNYLANAGSATAEDIADIGTRISGMGRAFGYTQGQILGIATTMRELGISVERGSTAFITFNNRIRYNLARVIKYTGDTKEGLRDMLDKKPFEAFIHIISKFSEFANGSGTDLSRILKDIRVTGSGVSELIAKMGSNTAFLQQRTDEATESLTNMNYSLREQEIVLRSIPAQWKILWNTIKNTFQSSGLSEMLLKFIKDMNGAFYLGKASERGDISFKEWAEGFSPEGFKAAQAKINDIASRKKRSTGQSNRTYYDPNYYGAEYKRQTNESTGGVDRVYSNSIQAEINLISTLTGNIQNLEQVYKKGNTTLKEKTKLQKEWNNEISNSRKRIKNLVEQGNKNRTGESNFESGDTTGESSPRKSSKAGKVDIPGEFGSIDYYEALLKSVREKLEKTSPNSPLISGLKKQFIELTGVIERLRDQIYGLDTIGSKSDLEDQLKKVQKILDGLAPDDVKRSFYYDLFQALGQRIDALNKLEEIEKNSRLDEVIYRKIPALLDKLPTKTSKLEIPARQQIIQANEDNYKSGLNAIDNKFILGGFNNIAQYEKIRKEYVLDKELELARAKFLLAKKTDADYAKLQEEFMQSQLNRELYYRDKKEQLQRDIAKASISIAQESADAIFAIADFNSNQRKNVELDNIDSVYKQRLDAAQNNSTLEKAITEDRERKKDEIEKKYKKEAQKMAVKQAIINTALAVLSAATTTPFIPAGLIAMALAAATGAIQIGTIKSQKYAIGGFTGKGLLGPDETGKRPVGVVHENEYVAPETQVRENPMLFHELNQNRLKRIRGFALGGFSTNSPQTIRPGSIRGELQSTSNIDLIASGIAKGVYEGARMGSKEGSLEGSYFGLSDANRNKERQENLRKNTNI